MEASHRGNRIWFLNISLTEWGKLEESLGLKEYVLDEEERGLKVFPAMLYCWHLSEVTHVFIHHTCWKTEEPGQPPLRCLGRVLPGVVQCTPAQLYRVVPKGRPLCTHVLM